MAPSEHELDAARIVAVVTGFGWRPLDPGGGRAQLADFELLDGLDLPVGLLEVTATVPEALAAFQGAVRSKTWSFPELTYCWVVWARQDVRVNDLHTALPRQLRVLERAELVGDLLDGSPLPEALSALGVTGVATWHRVEEGDEALVVLHPQQVAGFYSMVAVTPAVQSAIDRLDNQEKLYYARPGIGELFVWLEGGFAPVALQLAELAAFTAQVATVPPPVLPEGITGVWAATRASSPARPASALWYTRGTRWRRFQPPVVPPAS